jgi:glycosyltransferase involved in cell wall biosynthesis
MTSPAISCLIPVFNAERFLPAAMDSVLGQTFADFEVVVVDDGSTDRSAEIIADYARRDPRVKLFSKPNGGIVSALNFGLQHCRGDHVARMDADDIALPDRFAVQMATFAQHPDAVAVGGLIQSIDENGNPISAPGSPSRVTQTRLDCFPPVVANVQHSAGTFRRSALVAVGGYRRTFPHAEDYDLYLRLAAYGRFYNPPTLVLWYRVHGGSLSMVNLQTQERSAVLAELSAQARAAGLPDPGDAEQPLGLAEYNQRLGDRLCPVATIERYIEFRLWRRLSGARAASEPEYRARVLRGLFDRASYRTRADRQLNRRIVLSMGRKLVRRATTASRQLLGPRPPSVGLAR